MLRNCFLDFAVEHWFGCRATEPGFAGDIDAIEVWLIDWLTSDNLWGLSRLHPHRSVDVSLADVFPLPGISLLLLLSSLGSYHGTHYICPGFRMPPSIHIFHLNQLKSIWMCVLHTSSLLTKHCLLHFCCKPFYSARLLSLPTRTNLAIQQGAFSFNRSWYVPVIDFPSVL